MNSVAVGIINQINTQMINAGVKFVVQVGDLGERGRAYVELVHDMDVIGDRLVEIYESL